MTIARVLVGLVLSLAVLGSPASAFWPFDSSEKKETKTQKKPPLPPKKPAKTEEPGFFGKVGETLGLKKKPEPKRTSMGWTGVGKPGEVRSTSKKAEETSWFGSLFKPEEPKPPRTMNDFMALERMDP